MIALRAHVAPGPYTLVTRLSARIEKAGHSAFVSGASLGIGEDVMDLGAVRVEGLGAPIEAELHWSPRSRVARVDAPSVDLARIEVLVGSPWGLRGTGSLEAAFDLTSELPTLGGRLRVTDGSARGIAPLDLDVSLRSSQRTSQCGVPPAQR